MLPLLPFAAGILTGVVALRVFKNDAAKRGLDKAQSGIRNATVSSLEAIENASSRARRHLASEAEDAAKAAPSAEPAAAPAKAARKPAAPRKRASRAKSAGKAAQTQAAKKDEQ